MLASSTIWERTVAAFGEWLVVVISHACVKKNKPLRSSHLQSFWQFDRNGWQRLIHFHRGRTATLFRSKQTVNQTTHYM